jgi:prevent-host-death family protein
MKIMVTVGIRELKRNLSAYLRSVKDGKKVVITDRKKEIAVIVPFREAGGQEKILQLVREGVADWSGEKPRGMSDRIKSKGKSISSAVVEDRR